MSETTQTPATMAGLDALRELTAYALANMVSANCNNDEATAFFVSIRDEVIEAIEYADGDEPDDDRRAEIADGAPDVYNYTRMMEAIGTGAYLDTSEMATGQEDMVTLAGYVLYELARQLVDALVTEYANARDEADSE